MTAGNDIIINDNDNNFKGSLFAYNNITIYGDDNIFNSSSAANNDILIYGDADFNSTVQAGRDIAVGNGSAFVEATMKGNFSAVRDIAVANRATLAIGADLTATPDYDDDGTGSLVVSNGGTLDLGTHDLTMASDVFLSDGAVLTVFNDGSDSGTLIIATGNDLTSDGRFVLNLGSDSDDLDAWDGEQVIVADSGAFDPAIVNSLFYDFETDESGGQVTLKIKGGPSISRSLQALQDAGKFHATPNARNVFAMMDRYYGPSGNTELVEAIKRNIAAINGLSPAEADIAVRQLIGESMVNTLAAVESTAYKTQNVVFGRLDRIREAQLDNPIPPAAGAGGELNRVWVGGFGVFAEQDDRDHVYGYDYDAHGVALGLDRQVYAVPGLRVGASAVFAKGDLDNNDARTTADLNTTGLGLYASYLAPVGVFVDASVAYGTTEVEYKTNLATGGGKTGAFDVDSWQFGARTGAVLQAGSAQIIPSLGVRYTRFKQHGWAEALDAAASSNNRANSFDGRGDSQIDVPLQVRVNTTIDTPSVLITPELRLGATFAARKPDHGLSVGFVGSNLRTEIKGVGSKTTTFNAGAGLKFTTPSAWDAYVNYDVDTFSGFTSHNVSAGIGVNF